MTNTDERNVVAARARWDAWLLAVGASLALVFFRSAAPNGDGRVYMRQIETGVPTWNPNHLLFQPSGLLFTNSIRWLGVDWTLFAVLQLLSGIAAVTSLVIFHRILLGLSISRLTSMLASCGLFFSAHFLSLAIAEEFYMIQMPPLMLAFAAGLAWVSNAPVRISRAALLVSLGLMVGLAAAVSLHNAFLLAAMGAIGFATPSERWWDARRSLYIWIPAALLLIPVVLVPYAISGGGRGLLPWLTSYGGSEGNAAEVLYWVRWDVGGVVTSLATLAYGATASLFAMGPLGPVVHSLFASQPLEFTPNTVQLSLTAAVFTAMVLLSVPFSLWLLRVGRHHAAVRFAAIWSVGFVAFNFVWTDNTDQFWFQVLPAFWLIVAIFCETTSGRWRQHPSATGWRRLLLITVIPLLAALNVSAVVIPRKSEGLDQKRAAFSGLMRSDDLLIAPGWDDIIWMGGTATLRHDRLLLMERALLDRRGEKPGMTELPALIRTHLSTGRRVIVGRVFDLDSEGRPWDQLAKLGWSRRKLRTLFQEFDSVTVGVVDGVVFRELRLRSASDPPAAR